MSEWVGGWVGGCQLHGGVSVCVCVKAAWGSDGCVCQMLGVVRGGMGVSAAHDGPSRTWEGLGSIGHKWCLMCEVWCH